MNDTLVRPGQGVVFVGGKGGVGKTSVASALAWSQARAGRDVLVVSTDPAHNLGHLWGQRIGDSPVEVARVAGGGRLRGLELDPQRTADTHLDAIRHTLESYVAEHLRPQVKRYVDSARTAPGAHEAALVERIAELCASRRDDELLIFDTAPTGHTTRLLELPELMRVWADGLLAGRTRAQRYGSAFVRAGGQEDAKTERDARIRGILLRRRERFEALRRLITDPALCGFVVVLTPERLPVLETVELVADLQRQHVSINGLVVNRRSPAQGAFLARRREVEEAHIADLRAQVEQPVVEVDLLPDEPVGEEGITTLAAALHHP
ncbi:MAG: ArsA family ATPase [Mobilicoccus sp.]|nr:ArsA family ATPase [Mobilicoccus sp.]